MPFNKNDVSGTVILHNSAIEVIANLKTYLTQIDHLYIIDNSEIVNYELIQHIKLLPNVTYIANNNNKGIAYALNQAASMAIEGGYQFLLTMDDDTSLPIDAIKNMLSYVNRYSSEKLGIIGGQSDSRLFEDSTKIVSYTITSGNLLNLSAYKDCGPFMNELFIDFVDHEYCFRLLKNKYKIVEMNSIHLIHRLGLKKQLIIFKYRFPFYWISHNPLRVYYKTRNCIFVLKNYTYVKVSIKFIFYKEVIKDFIKIIFLEDDKRHRFVLFITAMNDGFKGSLGRKTITA